MIEIKCYVNTFGSTKSLEKKTSLNNIDQNNGFAM